jgi:hypothetical protein
MSPKEYEKKQQREKAEEEARLEQRLKDLENAPITRQKRKPWSGSAKKALLKKLWEFYKRNPE